MLTKKYINTLERVHSISLEKAQPGRELWHGGDSWLHDDKVAEWSAKRKKKGANVF